MLEKIFKNTIYFINTSAFKKFFNVFSLFIAFYTYITYINLTAEIVTLHLHIQTECISVLYGCIKSFEN